MTKIARSMLGGLLLVLLTACMAPQTPVSPPTAPAASPVVMLAPSATPLPTATPMPTRMPTPTLRPAPTSAPKPTVVPTATPVPLPTPGPMADTEYMVALTTCDLTAMQATLATLGQYGVQNNKAGMCSLATEFKVRAGSVRDCWSTMPMPNDEDLKMHRESMGFALAAYYDASGHIETWCVTNNDQEGQAAVELIDDGNKIMVLSLNWLNDYTASH
jgi:hypothetical protein